MKKSLILSLSTVIALLAIFVTLYYFKLFPFSKDDSLADGLTEYQRGNFVKAVELYTKSCAEGNTPSCVYLAEMYQNGQGVKKDNIKAKELFQQSCNNGDTKSCKKLELFSQKTFKQEDIDLLNRYTKSCNDGNTSACYNLATMYASERGTKQDLTKARELLKKACKGGDIASCGSAGAMYLTAQDAAKQQDFVQAADLFKHGCDEGDTISCGALANLYAKGQGVPQDKNLAQELLQKSCNNGQNYRNCQEAKQFQ